MHTHTTHQVWSGLAKSFINLLYFTLLYRVLQLRDIQSYILQIKKINFKIVNFTLNLFIICIQHIYLDVCMQMLWMRHCFTVSFISHHNLVAVEEQKRKTTKHCKDSQLKKCLFLVSKCHKFPFHLQHKCN